MGDRYTAGIITDKTTGGGYGIYAHWSGWRGNAVMVTAVARYLKLDSELQRPERLVTLVADGFGYHKGDCLAEITRFEKNADDERMGDALYPLFSVNNGVAIDLSSAGGKVTLGDETYDSLESFVREVGPQVMQDQLDRLGYLVDYEREAQGRLKTDAKHWLIMRSQVIGELENALEDLGIDPIAPVVAQEIAMEPMTLELTEDLAMEPLDHGMTMNR